MYELVAVGCGPGDPDLLTIKAVEAIRGADIVACPTAKEEKPSMALAVVDSILDHGKQEILPLVFPMTKDKDILEDTWRRNTSILADAVLTGRRIVYLTIGDPYLYSTWIYLHRELKERYPQIKITVVPGIVSPFAFASKVGISLAEGAQKMAVIPSCYNLESVREIARNSDTLVFLKDGRYFEQVIAMLRESGFTGRSEIAIGQDLGTDHEIIKRFTLARADEAILTTKYFSIMVAKRA